MQLHNSCFPRIFGIFFRDTCYGKLLFYEVSLEIFRKLPKWLFLKPNLIERLFLVTDNVTINETI